MQNRNIAPEILRLVCVGSTHLLARVVVDYLRLSKIVLALTASLLAFTFYLKTHVIKTTTTIKQYHDCRTQSATSKDNQKIEKKKKTPARRKESGSPTLQGRTVSGCFFFLFAVILQLR